jgi:hypothetical protein
MSLFLNRVVQADCPSCKNTLRIPANWLSEPIRCKHCGLVFQAKAKRGNLFKKALNAASHLGSRMRSRPLKKAPPVPTAVPVAGAAGRTVPSAAPLSRRRGERRGSTWAKLAFVAIFLLGVGSLAAVVHHLHPQLFSADNPENKPVARGTAGDKATGVFPPSPSSRSSTPPSGRREPEFVGPPEPRVPAAAKNPKRLLGIGVSNYPYANPVSSGGTGPKAFPQVMQHLADILHVSNDQVNVVSDRGPGVVPPTKAVISYALASFLGSSRPQDRVVVVFAGHAVEQGGSVYLLPLLGESNDPQSLLPLDDVYRLLAACPAQEKLLILDVCRFDKQRGAERGMVERMSEAFEAALHKPPRSVQVLSACAAGQYSWEIDQPERDLEGGVFLNAIVQVRRDGGLVDAGPQGPGDPLPVEVLHKALLRRTDPKVRAYLTKNKDEKETQTPRLFGQPPDRTVAYDPRQPAPPRLVIAQQILAREFDGGIATAADVAPILDFINRIPPIKPGDKIQLLQFAGLPPFAKAKLVGYKDDGKKTEFRQFVLQAIDLLDKQYKSPAFMSSIPLLPENEPARTTFLMNLRNIQEKLAMDAMVELDRRLAELDSVREDRVKEPKLWQAGYDYVYARVLMRKAYLLEYQQMLGLARQGGLPPFDKAIHKGFKLASKPTMTEREAVGLVGTAKKVLERMARDHKGTPWELVARQASLTSLGMEWQPY